MCVNDEGCEDGDVVGMCQPNGYCSFPNEDCPSGQAYGDLAPSNLQGECVEPGSGTESATSTTNASSPTSDSTTQSGSSETMDGEELGTESTSSSSGTVASSDSTTEPSTSTTGDTDTSTTGDTDTTSTTGDTDASTTTGGEVDPWAFCTQPDDCPIPGSLCLEGSVCAPPCVQDPITPCPYDPLGPGFPVCVFACELGCLDGQCPEGMTCDGQDCIWM